MTRLPTRPPTRLLARPLALVLSVLAALATVLLGAAPASAHAALVGSDPADGAQVAQAPQSVTLTFNEDIQQPAYVVVTAAGERVEQGTARIDANTVTADVAPDAAAGSWTVAYRVVSVDGHPVTGEIGFEVAATAQPTQTAPPSPTASEGATPEAEAGSTTPAGARTDDDGSWPWHVEHVVLGVAVLAVAAGVLVWARRRPGRDAG